MTKDDRSSGVSGEVLTATEEIQFVLALMQFRKSGSEGEET
jgi:hypothetical protein